MTGTRLTVPLRELPALPRDSEGPVFREPWEATAFALVLRLHEAGHFTWAEWTEALSAEIRAAQGAQRPAGDTYYLSWLTALERLTTQKGLTDAATLFERKEAWHHAYLATPHGQPVELGDADRGRGHRRHHSPQ